MVKLFYLQKNDTAPYTEPLWSKFIVVYVVHSETDIYVQYSIFNKVYCCCI